MVWDYHHHYSCLLHSRSHRIMSVTRITTTMSKYHPKKNMSFIQRNQPPQHLQKILYPFRTPNDTRKIIVTFPLRNGTNPVRYGIPTPRRVQKVVEAVVVVYHPIILYQRECRLLLLRYRPIPPLGLPYMSMMNVYVNNKRKRNYDNNKWNNIDWYETIGPHWWSLPSQTRLRRPPVKNKSLNPCGNIGY